MQSHTFFYKYIQPLSGLLSDILSGERSYEFGTDPTITQSSYGGNSNKKTVTHRQPFFIYNDSLKAFYPHFEYPQLVHFTHPS